MDIKEYTDRELIRLSAIHKQQSKDSYAILKDIEQEFDRRYKQDLKRVADSQGQIVLSDLKGDE